VSVIRGSSVINLKIYGEKAVVAKFVVLPRYFSETDKKNPPKQFIAGLQVGTSQNGISVIPTFLRYSV
jgi:hypothetical protein